MLYMPSIFGEDLMDRWFDDMDREFARMEKPLYGHNAKNLMKTDVRERDDSYEVDIELPGFHKDEVQLSLENGYLNITAAKGLDKDEKDKKTGKLTLKKGLKKGTYKFKVKVKAAGNKYYNALTKTVKVTVRVK